MNTKTLQTVNIDGREYITVKQYADETGRTPSAVYQELKNDADGTGLTRYQHTIKRGNKNYQYIDVAALDDVVAKTDKELLTDNQSLIEENARLLSELIEARSHANDLKTTFDKQTVLMNQVFDELKTDSARKQEQIEYLTNQMETMNQAIRDKDALLENLMNKYADTTDKLDKRLAESHSIQLANATANNPGLLHRLFKKKSADFDVM